MTLSRPPDASAASIRARAPASRSAPVAARHASIRPSESSPVSQSEHARETSPTSPDAWPPLLSQTAKLGELIGGEGLAAPLVRKAQRHPLRSEWSKAFVESLVPAGCDERLQAILIRLDPGGRTGTTPLAKARRLFAYGTAGTARLVCDGSAGELLVSAGDSIVLEGPQALCWENAADGSAEILVVTAAVA